MFCFPYVESDLGYWYITWKVNTKNWDMNLKKNPFALYLWGWGFHTKPPFLNIFSTNPHFDGLNTARTLCQTCLLVSLCMLPIYATFKTIIWVKRVKPQSGRWKVWGRSPLSKSVWITYLFQISLV